MQAISDIKIIGIDQTRLPRVLKEPYIDLFFQLSEEAPEEWCEIFNERTCKIQPAIRIDKVKGLFIETYVREMEGIPAHLEMIKEKITDSNKQYLENIRQRTAAAEANSASLLGDGGKQGKLNAIVAALKFDV